MFAGSLFLAVCLCWVLTSLGRVPPIWQCQMFDWRDSSRLVGCWWVVTVLRDIEGAQHRSHCCMILILSYRCYRLQVICCLIAPYRACWVLLSFAVFDWFRLYNNIVNIMVSLIITSCRWMSLATCELAQLFLPKALSSLEQCPPLLWLSATHAVFTCLVSSLGWSLLLKRPELHWIALNCSDRSRKNEWGPKRASDISRHLGRKLLTVLLSFISVRAFHVT